MQLVQAIAVLILVPVVPRLASHPPQQLTGKIAAGLPLRIPTRTAP
jgi:hypothetical protein